MNASVIYGVKFPEINEALDKPVTVPAIEYKRNYVYQYNNDHSLDLSNHMLPSPYQGASGSCMFMSLTGTIEWWLAKTAGVEPSSEGEFDLSERVFMNLSKMKVGQDKISNWRTDSIERMNVYGKNILNRNWRYTKGWFKRNAQGKRVPAVEGDDKSFYSSSYNWVVELDQYQSEFVEIPKFKREVLLADKNKNQWAVGVAPETIVQDIKDALIKNQAPVNIIFNLYGLWHAVVIVGFDDHVSTEGCPLLSHFKSYMHDYGNSILEQAKQEPDLKLREKLIKRANKKIKLGTKVDHIYQEKGGCHSNGVFLVRDSVYKDDDGPLYDFDLNNSGDEEPYTKKVVMHEYRFMEVLGNHAFQILPL